MTNAWETKAKMKVFIIDEVHMLTTEAFNALLKNLEEPPIHAAFVLATTDPQKIPATILSRCLHISFARAKNEDLTRALKRIVKSEKIDIDEPALASIVTNADGSFRDAVKMLEQVSFHKGKISQEVAEEILALSRFSRRDTFLTHLRAKALKERAALGLRIHARVSFFGLPPVFFPPPGVGLANLKAAFESFVDALPKLEKLVEERIKKVVSLEEKISHIRSFLAGFVERAFSEVIKGSRERTEVIVSFLAILELARQRFVDLEQGEPFGDIIVKRI